MKRLGTLSPLPRYDSQSIRDLFPSEASEHSGRMRVSLITEILAQYSKTLRVIGDPLIGVGSTCVGASSHGIDVIGCEYDPDWVEVARSVASRAECIATILQGNAIKTPPPLDQKLDGILTSPPFPNSHSQGGSEMQEGMREQRNTFAGNEFALSNLWGCGSKPKKDAWITTLGKILGAWCQSLVSNGIVLIHVKDFVREGKIVDVGEWVAEIFRHIGIVLEGDWGVPLSYTSGFQEWKRFHQREIIRWINDSIVDLKCEHRMMYDKPPATKPKKKVCTECPKENHVEVREERIIVGRWKDTP